MKNETCIAAMTFPSNAVAIKGLEITLVKNAETINAGIIIIIPSTKVKIEYSIFFFIINLSSS